MAFEDIQAEIALLLSQMTEQPANSQELEVVIYQKLNELKAFGMPLPHDLVELEAALDLELSSETRRDLLDQTARR